MVTGYYAPIGAGVRTDDFASKTIGDMPDGGNRLSSLAGLSKTGGILERLRAPF